MFGSLNFVVIVVVGGGVVVIIGRCYYCKNCFNWYGVISTAC